jgi:hypothetical protein
MDYYIDIDQFFELISLTDLTPPKEVTTETMPNETGEEALIQTTTKTLYPSVEINAPKYELLSSMIETVMNHAPDDEDSALGFEHTKDKAGFAFNLSFNTLEYYEILKQK